MYHKPHGKYKVFLSHATADLGFARALATDLFEAGYEVFLDDWSIELGENIYEKISQGLESSSALILLISKDFLLSACCKEEWTAFYALFSKTHPNAIYPVLLDDSAPPAMLSARKYIRVRSGQEYQDFIGPLLRALGKHLEETAAP